MSSRGSSSPDNVPGRGPPSKDGPPPVEDPNDVPMEEQIEAEEDPPDASEASIGDQAGWNPNQADGRPASSLSYSLHQGSPDPSHHSPESSISVNSPNSSTAARRAQGVIPSSPSPVPSAGYNDDHRVPSRNTEFRNLTPDSAGLGYATPEPPPLGSDDTHQVPFQAANVAPTDQVGSSGGSSSGSLNTVGTVGTITPLHEMEFMAIQRSDPTSNVADIRMRAPLVVPSSGAHGGARTRRRFTTTAETIHEEDVANIQQGASSSVGQLVPCICTRCRSLFQSSASSQNSGTVLCEGCMGNDNEASVALGDLIDSSSTAAAAAAAAVAAAALPPAVPRRRSSRSRGPSDTVTQVRRWLETSVSRFGRGEGMDMEADEMNYAPLSAAEAIADQNWSDSLGNIADTNVCNLPSLGQANDSDDSDDGADQQFRTRGHGSSGFDAGASVSRFGAGVSGFGAGVSGHDTGVVVSDTGISETESQGIDNTSSGVISDPNRPAEGSNTPSLDTNLSITGVTPAAIPPPVRPTDFPTGFGTSADGVRAILSNRRSSLGSGGSGGSGVFPGVPLGESDSGVASGGSEGGSGATGGDGSGVDSGASGSNSPARTGSPRDFRSRLSPYTTTRRSSRDKPNSPSDRGTAGGKMKKSSGSRMALITYDIADDAFAAMFPKLRAIKLRNLFKDDASLHAFKLQTFNIPESYSQSSSNVYAQQNSVARDFNSEGLRNWNTSKDSLGDSFERSDEEDSL